MLNKIQVLDSLRAFAAISVCLFHFICTTVGFTSSEIVLSIFRNGSYGVQMFFVISGFVIPWAMYQKHYRIRDFSVFLFKRVSRLEPPYLFSIFLALLLLFLRSYLRHGDANHLGVTAKGVFLHLGYLIPFFKDYQWLNGVYWSLAVEFQYYFFIALLYVPLLRLNLFFRVVLYVTCMVVCLPNLPAFLPFWLPVFMLGILLFLYKSKNIAKAEYYAATATFLLFMFWRYHWAAVFFSMLPVVCVLRWPDLKVFGLHAIGKWSYSLYLVHPLLGAALINILSHSTRSPVHKILVLVAGIAITCLGSYVLYLIIENPSKKFSSGIKYSRSQETSVKAV
jgi:peptidoglycan/LPS O-acetylase OafA/YrhL